VAWLVPAWHELINISISNKVIAPLSAFAYADERSHIISHAIIMPATSVFCAYKLEE
jgi:hypothetical protein